MRGATEGAGVTVFSADGDGNKIFNGNEVLLIDGADSEEIP